MKTDLRHLPQLLRDLSGTRVLCLYGDDRDAIRDGARHLVVAEAGTADDPFRVTECAGDDRDAIAAALASPGLTGGRAVVWVRHASERMLPLVEQAAGQDGALLVIEYADATAKSRVRSVVERHPRGWAVACYRREEAAQAAIRSALAEIGVEAAPGIAEALAAQAEREGCPARALGTTAALYAGKGGQLGPEDVAALAGLDAADSLERGLLAGLGGDVRELDATLSALFADGTAAIAVLRSALFQLHRLRAMAAPEGRSAAEAGRAARPPTFRRPDHAVAGIAARWSADELSRAAYLVWDAERRSKATGVPQEAVCRAVLSDLARSGAARAARPRGARAFPDRAESPRRE